MAADVAAENAVVWVQDYQLQLVPAMLRALRPGRAEISGPENNSQLAEILADMRRHGAGTIFIDGAVDRISPEAPVPVVRITREEERCGGAANVAFNAASLGAQQSVDPEPTGT